MNTQKDAVVDGFEIGGVDVGDGAASGARVR